MRLSFALLSLLFLAQPSWEIPEGAFLFEPPEVYQTWHDEVMECVQTVTHARIDAPYEELEFWAVPAPFGFRLYGSGPYAGFFDSRPEPWDRIFLVMQGRDSERLVKHEMIHHALDPFGGHPEPPFGWCEMGLTPRSR